MNGIYTNLAYGVWSLKSISRSGLQSLDTSPQTLFAEYTKAREELNTLAGFSVNHTGGFLLCHVIAGVSDVGVSLTTIKNWLIVFKLTNWFGAKAHWLTRCNFTLKHHWRKSMNPNLTLRSQVAQVVLSGILLLLVAAPLLAQEAKKPLVNSDVVEMAKAGLPESTIVLAIQKGPSQFDTSPQALIQLKKEGVSTAMLDAMIRAGSPPVASSTVPVQTAVPTRNVNPLDPLSTSVSVVPAGSGVVLVDGDIRISMKYSSPEMRTNSMLGAVVNPFHKSRVRTALKGNHAQLRTKNTSPLFEVGIAADANPSDVVAVVKLKAKSETREIETGRGSITGVSSGFRKEDLVAVSIDELPGSANQSIRTYRVKTVNPLPPGEYSLVYGGGVYYDFGVDAN